MNDIAAGNLQIRLTGDDDVAPPRQRAADRVEGLAAHDQRVRGGYLAEVAQICRHAPRKRVVLADHPVLRNSQHQRDDHTATGALIGGCGSYPTISMSSNRKSKRSVIAGFN